MGMFGAPIASEHHAVEACVAALEMQQSIRDYARDSQAGPGSKLKIRVGLHSGEIVVLTSGEGDRVEYDADGPTVPIAARMEQTAAPGEVYLTATTESLAARRIETEALTPVHVKGVSVPIAVFSLRRVRSIEDSGADGFRTPFVGRTAELNQLKSILATCIEAGHGQTVYVRGEPGIGKTRLVERFAKFAAEKELSTHRGPVLPFGVGKGQDAIRSLVSALIGIAPESGKDDRASAAETVLEKGQLDSDQAVFLNDLLDLPQPLDQKALYDVMENSTRSEGKQRVVSTLVTTVSKRRPALIVVEDVHWADALTLANLSSIAKTVTECPALLVMTSRIDGDQLDQGWCGSTDSSPITSIDLGPLREPEAVALIGEFIDPSDELAHSCLERAAGNPLFLEQLLRNAQEGTTDRLPESIQSLVIARMDRLEPEEKQALQAASVLGQRFDASGLGFLLNKDHYDVGRLVAHNLVHHEGAGCLFAHALVQESVYASLLKRKRRDLHRKAAGWFAASDLTLHAEHLGHAGDEGAAEAFLAAANEQAGQYRLDRALMLVERGLRESSQGVHYSLQSLQGELLRDLGRSKEAIDVYRGAKLAATTDVDRCRASLGVAEGLRLTEAQDELLEELLEAETIASNNGLSLELARVHLLKGGLSFRRGDVEGCVESNKAALRYTEGEDSPETTARILSGLGDAEYVRGRMISAYRCFHQCVEVSREHGLGKVLAANLVMRGAALFWQSEFDRAAADYTDAIALARETGHKRAEMVVLDGEVALVSGDFGVVNERADRRLGLARQLGSKNFIGWSLMRLGQVAFARGSRAEAEGLVEEALEILRDGGMAFAGPLVLGTLALITRDANRRHAALSEGEELLHGNNVSHNFLNFYRDAIETCLEMAAWDEVDRYAQALEDYTSAEPLPLVDFYIARGRTLAEFGRGGRDDAATGTLQRLHDDAERAGLSVAKQALEKALSSV